MAYAKNGGNHAITRSSTRCAMIQRGQIEGSRKIDFINSNHKTAGVGVRRRLQGVQKDITQ